MPALAERIVKLRQQLFGLDVLLRKSDEEASTTPPSSAEGSGRSRRLSKFRRGSPSRKGKQETVTRYRPRGT